MTAETAIYALDTHGPDVARVAGLARYLTNPLIYVRTAGGDNRILDYHGIDWLAPTCDTPGCGGLTPPFMAQWLLERDPTTLIMDAQPYAAGQQLWKARSHRSIAIYRRGTQDPELDPHDFDMILKVDINDHVTGTQLGPILAFEPNEIRPRAEARQILGGGDRPIVVIVDDHNTPAFASFVIDACVRRGVDHVVIFPGYPLMPLMAGADLIVSHADYTVLEAQAVGTPIKAIASPQRPDSVWRANTDATDLTNTIAALDVATPWDVTYDNFAQQAAALIEGSE